MNKILEFAKENGIYVSNINIRTRWNKLEDKTYVCKLDFMKLPIHEHYDDDEAVDMLGVYVITNEARQLIALDGSGKVTNDMEIYGYIVWTYSRDNQTDCVTGYVSSPKKHWIVPDSKEFRKLLGKSWKEIFDKVFRDIRTGSFVQ